ncbi:MAG: hypothetical protein Q7S55_02335 [Nanoarchaeota archaeon]|nr:hypothetical protein [Nanoarchaeota archaeon]
MIKVRAAGPVTAFVTCPAVNNSKWGKYAGGRDRTCVGTKPIDDLQRV